MPGENYRQFHQYGVNNRYNPFRGRRGRFHQGALYPPRPFFPRQPSRFHSNSFNQNQHYPQSPEFFQPTPFLPVHPHPEFSFGPNLFPFPPMYANSALPNMPYLRCSNPFDAQHLQGNQYFEMNETDANGFLGVNNNCYACGSPQVSYTMNNMHMNTSDSMERSQSFIMQFDSSHPWYSGHAANRVQDNVNYDNTVTNPTQNFYETTETFIPTSANVTAENITTNTNPLTRNTSMSISVNTAYSNHLNASYTESLGLTESNSSQFHNSGAIIGQNNNFVNGNNYESNLNQSYNNWVHGNNGNYLTGSNNSFSQNYETNLMGQGDNFNEFLSNLNNMKTEIDSDNQYNRTSTPDSSSTSSSAESTPPRNKNTSATSNPDRIKFVNENVIKIGSIFYSRTLKENSSIYVNPDYIPNLRDQDQGNNININQEPESQLYTSDTSFDDTSEEQDHELSGSSGSGQSSADESIENSQIDNIKLNDNVCRLKSECFTHRQLTQRHKSYSVLNKSI